MLSFLNRHLWIVIVLIGVLILLAQNNERAHLASQLGESSKVQPIRSTQTRAARVQFDLPSSSELLRQYEEVIEIDGTSSLFALAEILSSASSPDLIQLLDDLPDEPSFQDLRNQLNTLLQLFDPAAALEREGNVLKQLGIFMTLARQSPDKALHWFSRHEVVEYADYFRMRLNEGFLLTDPSSYTGSWNELELDPPFFPAEALDSIAAVLKKSEGRGDREIMINSLLISASIEDPGLARSYAAELKLDDEELLPALRLISSYEMGSSELLDWTLTLQSSADSKLALIQDNFMATFAARDLQGAAQWLTESTVPSEAKDPLIQRYASLLQELDPVQALSWIDKIEDPGLRAKSRKKTLINWRIKDPQTAATWEAKR